MSAASLVERWSQWESKSLQALKRDAGRSVSKKVPCFTRSDTRLLCLSLSAVIYLQKVRGPRGAHWGSSLAFVVSCPMLMQKVAKQSVFASAWLQERERCSERCQNVLLSPPPPCLSLKKKISLWTRIKPVWVCVRACVFGYVCALYTVTRAVGGESSSRGCLFFLFATEAARLMRGKSHSEKVSCAIRASPSPPSPVVFLCASKQNKTKKTRNTYSHIIRSKQCTRWVLPSAAGFTRFHL